MAEFYQTFKEELGPIFSVIPKHFKTIFPNFFYEASIILILNQRKIQEAKRTKDQYL